ncbi:MAG TPA: alanine racemase [Desulfomonilaceae bacterium]|nr:alanine racemase [Desulfomonilaceae bacterium]
MTFECSASVPDEETLDQTPSSQRTRTREKQGIENVGFLDLSEVIQVIKPSRVLGPGIGPVSGIAIDTRKPMGEDFIFWALKGEHFNGNDFVEEALHSGIKAAVTNRLDLLDKPFSKAVTILVVDDPLQALQKLASWYRRRFPYPVVGITGSNGKTLVKEMLASILCLERKTYRSPLSYNTQVGAALGLLGMRPEHKIALIEAGISLPNEMDRLEEMIAPDHGILTVISKAHIGGLGSLESTLEQKKRLFKHLDSESFLVLNADDPLSMSVRNSTSARVVTFGLSETADVAAEDIAALPEKGHQFTMRLFGDNLDVTLPVPGRFNILNALAAAAAATMLGASPESIRKGLREFHPSPMRLEIHTTVTGVTLINDTYNSDPASMKGALDVLAKVGRGRRKIAILSEMLDLGLHSREEHLDVGKEVVRTGVDHLITVGENAALIGRAARLEGMHQGRITNTRSYNEAAEELEKIMNRGDVVLFKGSRWFRLERIARELVGSIGPTRLVVNLDAIAANVKTIKGLVGDDVSLMTVVKSFGYGNDSIRTSRVALENGVNYLAVAFPDEGATLRENRVDAPILVFNVLSEEVDKIVRYDLSAVVSSLELAESLNRAAGGRKIPVHLKIDTGMGRSGIWVEEAIPFIERVFCVKNLEIEGIMTHFSSADDPDADDYTLMQINSFERLLKDLRRLGYSFRYVHAANTSATVRFPQTRYNMVRPGLGIYGMYPSPAIQSLLHLEQVITFSTKIAQIKEAPPGRCISYNRRFVTPGHCRIATLHVGYNDGYPRFQSNVGQVLIRGRRCNVLGTVCMDAIMIDVTDVPDARVGDEAVLIGRQGNEEILADEIAANGGTINYEIVCKISPRVTRIFVQS